MQRIFEEYRFAPLRHEGVGLGAHVWAEGFEVLEGDMSKMSGQAGTRMKIAPLPFNAARHEL